MNANVTRISDLAHIEAQLNYLAPMAERPRNYTFDPPPGVPRSNSTHEAHTVAIASWSVSGHLSGRFWATARTRAAPWRATC